MYREAHVCPKELQARNRELESTLSTERVRAERAASRSRSVSHLLNINREEVRELRAKTRILERRCARLERDRPKIVERVVERRIGLPLMTGLLAGVVVTPAVPFKLALIISALGFVSAVILRAEK